MTDKPRRDHLDVNAPTSASGQVSTSTRALRSIVTIQSSIPEDAYTAQTLGEQRSGSGVVIRDSGLVLTIGYLITEAESVWIARADGRVVPGHALAVDQESGVRTCAGARPARLSRARIGTFRRSADRRSGGCRGRRGDQGRSRVNRRKAGVRGILGIFLDEAHFHRAGSSVLGRRRRDRPRRPASRHWLAACRATDPQRRNARHQHDRADRPPAARSSTIS